jgi:ssDNA-binding replication factor A large subunit
MSSQRVTQSEVSVDEQTVEQEPEQEFRPSVEQEIQAKVDANHPDGIVQEYAHLPLEQEERIRAREAELERISAQAELGGQDGRAERTREVVVERRRTRRRIQGTPDPREELSRDELGRVNREANRIAERVDDGPCRAAVARSLAERVRSGQDLPEAVFETLDEQLEAPGAVIPISEISDVDTPEVSIEGEIVELWEPSSHAIQQVGLIADETSKIKFTVWKKSRQTKVREGQRVRFRAAKKNWYRGRCSIALTYHSRIVFPKRDPWWEG